MGAVVLAALVAALPSRPGGGHRFLAVFAVRLWDAARFNFGLSTISALPAATELVHRIPSTLELVGCGALIALCVGAPLGILLGTRRTLRAAGPFMQIVAAAPVFCAGLGLLWLAVRVLHWDIDSQLAISEHDPLAGTAEYRSELGFVRGEWRPHTRVSLRVALERNHFDVRTEVLARNGETTVFTREYRRRIARRWV